MAKKVKEGVRPLICYTLIRKKNGYFSLVKVKAIEFEIIKNAQETTQEQAMRQVDKEFQKMRIDLLKPENKNDDGTASV